MKGTSLMFEDGRFETTSRDIADNCGVKHVAVLNLIKRYQREVSGVGAHEKLVMRTFKTKGRTGEEAVLDEPQTLFIISLMKNSPAVVRYKENFITSLFEQREMISRLAEDVVELRFPAFIPELGAAGADKEVAQ